MSAPRTPTPDYAAASAAAATLDAWLNDTGQADALITLRIVRTPGGWRLGELADNVKALDGFGFGGPTSWTTARVGEALVALERWLGARGARGARATLRGIAVVSPVTQADAVTLGELADAARALDGAQ